jgi:hypothetical protein
MTLPLVTSRGTFYGLAAPLRSALDQVPRLREELRAAALRALPSGPAAPSPLPVGRGLPSGRDRLAWPLAAWLLAEKTARNATPTADPRER